MHWIIPDGAMVPAWNYMLIAALATLLIAVGKGGFGGGIGVFATPLFLLAIPANIALSLILPLLITCDLFTLRKFPRDWHPRSFWLLVPGTLLGLFVGLYALIQFGRADVDGDRWIRLVVGIAALFFCFLQGIRGLLPKQSKLKPNLAVGSITGLLAGFTTMIAHAAGPVVNMFLLAQKIEPRKYVGTCARFFLTVNTIKVPFFIAATAIAQQEYLTFRTLKWNLWLLPLCPLGVGLGAWLHHRLSARYFTLVIYIALAVTAAKMILDAV